MTITIGEDTFTVYNFGTGVNVQAAIYTVWTYDINTGKYPLLYIGETGDLAQRIGTSHHKYSCWINHSTGNMLYVGIKPMPSSIYTREQRMAEELRLINLYKPLCNG